MIAYIFKHILCFLFGHQYIEYPPMYHRAYDNKIYKNHIRRCKYCGKEQRREVIFNKLNFWYIWKDN